MEIDTNCEQVIGKLEIETDLNVYFHAICFDNLRTVIRIYIIKPHMQNESDSIHSEIELNVKRSLELVYCIFDSYISVSIKQKTNRNNMFSVSSYTARLPISGVNTAHLLTFG